jgi:hypothetical protein
MATYDEYFEIQTPQRKSEEKKNFKPKICFFSNNYASQDKSKCLSPNIFRDTFKESRKESHVIVILY